MKKNKGRIKNPPKQKPQKVYAGGAQRPISIRALELALGRQK